MSFINTILKGFLGNKNQRDLNAIERITEKIKRFDVAISVLTSDQLRAKTQEFKETIREGTQVFTDKMEAIRAEIAQTKDFDLKEKLFSDIDLLQKESYQKQEEILLELLPQAFAVLRETAKRFTENQQISVTATAEDQLWGAQKNYVTLSGDQAVWNTQWDAAGKEIRWDMVHYDVQFIGGVALHQGKIAEMQTGEGKTLVATLPMYLNALTGRGVHVVTVNDYLAKRDSAWMAPIFEFHGLRVDCIDLYRPNSPERKNAYLADITYGTNNEFGFDYLRDNMTSSPEDLVQRELNYAIVDEVDSVLIDDARTPLIISGPVPNGDRQEYDVLKPRVARIVEEQKKELSKVFSQAKKALQYGDKKEGGFKLLQVFRGLPKYKPLIKFLSEEGTKTLLQKTEKQYMADNNREMPKVDKDLFFVIDEKNNQIELTDKGIEFISKGNDDPHFFILPDLGMEIAEIQNKTLSSEEEFKVKEELLRNFSIKSERIHTLNQLLKAYTLFEKDTEYVVIEGQVKIVDEQTGRIMEGRRYSDGLHQALEAKESVKIEAATQTFATVTLQNYFRMYNKLAGMTGTAETEASEFWEIYKLDVVVIPTNRPIQRKDHQDLIYKTNREKYSAVINQIVKLTQEDRRPVLVGTTSVEISELLSKALNLRKIPHNVLNAKLHKKEADIVAEAGRAGVVTIATNMAGRGTDIKINNQVKAAGGLAIIGTERHDSRRVDRQLRGRSGRQGDTGSSQFYISLEDHLMRLFGSERIASLMDRMGHKEGDVIQHSMVSKSIERAQKKVEENNFGIRKRLLEYDDVMNKQREVIYKRRKNALFGERLKFDIANLIFDTAAAMVSSHKMTGDYKNFDFECIKYFTMNAQVTEKEFETQSEEQLAEALYQAAMAFYQHKSELVKQKAFPVIAQVYQKDGQKYHHIQVPFSDGIKTLNISSNLEQAHQTKCESLLLDFEKNVCLGLIDEHWKRHLREMDDLRKSSQTAAYEQKDPLVIYKQESFVLFSAMLEKINKETVSFLFKGEIPVG